MLPTKRHGGWLPGIFSDFFDNDWMSRANSTAPAINIKENDTEYRVEVAAPGMTREDFKIRINEDNQLVVTMEKREGSAPESSNKKPYNDSDVRTESDVQGHGTGGDPQPNGCSAQKSTEAQPQKPQQSGQQGANEKPADERFLRREFSYTRFQQAMSLPENIDKDHISARMENGILEIVIPKDKAYLEQKKERHIEIG